MNAPNWYPGKEVTWFLKNINSYTKFKRQITSRAFLQLGLSARFVKEETRLLL